MLGTGYSNYTMDGIQDIAKKNIKYFTEKTPEQPDPLSKDAGCLFLFALVAIGFFGMMFYYCRNKARERAKKKTDKAKTVQEKAAKKAAKSGQCWPSHRQQKETDLEAQNNKVTEEEPRNPPPEIQVPENAYFADSPQVCIIRNSLGTQREKFYEILNAEKVPGYTPTPPPAYSPTRLKRLPTPPPQTLEESMQQCLENQRESCQDKTFEVIGGQIEMRVEDKTGVGDGRSIWGSMQGSVPSSTRGSIRSNTRRSMRRKMRRSIRSSLPVSARGSVRGSKRREA